MLAMIVIEGIENIQALFKKEIDHSWGNGTKHREEIFGKSSDRTGVYFYKWLRDNDFPQDLGLQVLCKAHHPKSGRPLSKGKMNDSKWLRSRYVDEGKSSREIAKKCGVSQTIILSRLKDFDIPRRKRGGFLTISF